MFGVGPMELIILLVIVIVPVALLIQILFGCILLLKALTRYIEKKTEQLGK